MSATNQAAATDLKSATLQPAKPEPLATPPEADQVAHAEPQAGGSYTRNLTTGELVKERAPTQPDQE